MVDYKFKKTESKLELVKFTIWLRTQSKNNITDHPVEFEVNVLGSKFYLHESADVALVIPTFITPNSWTHWTHSINITRLADAEFFNKLNPADSCTFIGYPSKKDSDPWWDTEAGLPIVRLASLASFPGKAFVNKSVNTTHARLVAGLSFAGSSGSPILNVGTPISAGEGLTLSGFIEPMIIGIMGGHWWADEEPIPELLRHTGLSYFIASIAVFELIEKYRSEKIE